MRLRIIPFTALLVFTILACSPSDGQSDAPATPAPAPAVEKPAPAPPPVAPAPVSAEPSDAPQILITNVDVFDGFADKLQARHVMVEIGDLFRNWNYAASDSDEYTKILGDIDATIAAKGSNFFEADAAEAGAAVEAGAASE